MLDGWRVYELHGLSRYSTLALTAEHGDGVTVSSVTFVAVNGHLKFLWV